MLSVGMARKTPAPIVARRPRRDDVRRRVLDAALEEFTRHGYQRASLDRIAAAAGFSKGAIYSNFAGKEDLFLSLMDQQVRDRLDRIGATIAAAGSGSGEDVVAEQVGRVLTGVIAADTAWQLLFLDYVTHATRDPQRHAQLTERRRRIRGVVATATAEMLGPDHPLWTRFTPDAIAITMLAISNGLALERIADPDGVPDDLLGRIMRSLLAHHG
jgi:AcrR family transcriptional regulator